MAVSRGAQTPAAAASAGLDIAPGWSLDPATKRYHITPRRGATSGRLTMAPVSGSDLEAFTVNASLRTRQIGTGGITRLSATKDTILFIRASAGPRETLYTVRLRPPATANQRTANQPNATKNKGGGWTTTTTTRNNPTLSALAVSPGTLDPAFAAATHAYTVDVAHDVEHLTAAPTAAGTATYTITPTDADPNTAGHQIALTAATGTEPAETTIAIALTDGTNMASYAITAKRAAPPPVAPITFELPEHCTLHMLGAGNWTPWRKYDSNHNDQFCAQTHGGRPHRSAEYYLLLVRQAGEVTIRTDNYPAAVLVVISADGEVIASDKRAYRNNQNYKPSLTLTLDRGAYVVEVGNKLYKGPNHDDGHRLGYWGDHIVRTSDYTLADLTISQVDLLSFDSEVLSYTRRVAADVSRVTVTTTPVQADTLVVVSPTDADTNTAGHQIDLDSDGETEITVTLSPRAVPGDWRVYRVNIITVTDTTSPLVVNDATLSALSLGSIDIGTFSRTELHYTYSAGFYMRLDGIMTTLRVTTNHSGATWTASPPDADPGTIGHQIRVDGDDTATVTVTSEDGLHSNTYVIERPAASAYRAASKDGCELCQQHVITTSANLWFGDGKIMTTSEYLSTVSVWDAESGSLLETLQFTPPPGVSGSMKSFWTDGETLWALFWSHSREIRLYAYSLATQQRLNGKSILLAARSSPNIEGLRFTGLWSDGATMYFIDERGSQLKSFDIASGQHLKTVTLPNWRRGSAAEDDPHWTISMWSDGKTLWVSHWTYVVKAYDLQTGAHLPALDLDFRRLSGRTFGGGLWSDGHTLWMTDYRARALFPYVLPENARLKSLRVSDGDIGVFNNGIVEYAATVPAGTTTTTVTAEQAFTGGSASVAYSTTDADTNADGHQVTLTAGQDNVVTITVTAPNGTDTETYTLTITHTT